MPDGTMTEQESKLIGEPETKSEEDLMGKSAAQVEQEVKPAKVKIKTQLHPCSWCGGTYVHVPETDKDIVIGMTLQAPPSINTRSKVSKEPYAVCKACVFKVFDNALGAARHYGTELTHLRGKLDNPELGHAATRRDQLFG